MWQTAPMPMTPYQVSMCRAVFQPSVATRSPGWMPSSLRAWVTCLARPWIRLQVVRTIGPSTEREITSRSPCQRSAWSRMRSTVIGQSCIKPRIVFPRMVLFL